MIEIISEYDYYDGQPMKSQTTWMCGLKTLKLNNQILRYTTNNKF